MKNLTEVFRQEIAHKSLFIWFIYLSFAWITSNQIAAKLIDGEMRIKDAKGRMVWIDSGETTFWITILFILFHVINICLYVFRTLALKHRHINDMKIVRMILVMLVGLAVTHWILNSTIEVLIRKLLPVLLAFIYLIIALNERLTICGHMVKSILKALLITQISIWSFSVTFPELATTECRGDKCTIIGALMNGIFPHENRLGQFGVLSFAIALVHLKDGTIPKVILISSFSFVILSGSRTALVAITMLVASRFIRKLMLAKLILYASVIASSLIWALPLEISLTGRVEIWEALRNQISETPSTLVFGEGPDSMNTLLNDRVFPFTITGVHNAFAHYLLTYGFIGLICFLYAMLSAINCSNHTTITLLIPWVIYSAVESSMLVALNNASFWYIVWILLVSGENFANHQIRLKKRGAG